MATNLASMAVEAPASRRARRRIGGVTISAWVGVVTLAVAAIAGLIVLLVPSLRHLWTAQDLRSTFL